VTDFNALLRLLAENNVEFIIVGGAAARSSVPQVVLRISK